MGVVLIFGVLLILGSSVLLGLSAFWGSLYFGGCLHFWGRIHFLGLSSLLRASSEIVNVCCKENLLPKKNGVRTLLMPSNAVKLCHMTTDNIAGIFLTQS